MGREHRVPTPTPFLYARGEGMEEIFLNEEIIPLAPHHLIRRAIQPNHIKFRTCTALAPMWTPLINETLWTKSGDPLHTLTPNLPADSCSNKYWRHLRLFSSSVIFFTMKAYYADSLNLSNSITSEVEVTKIILTKVLDYFCQQASHKRGSFSDLRFPSTIWASLWISYPATAE